MRRSIVILLITCLTILLGTSGAYAERKVALVIGNSDYQRIAGVGTASADASLLAETFRKSGFDEVTLRQNLTLSTMSDALTEFAVKANASDVAVFCYMGHGVELGGAQFLLPVDAALARDFDLPNEGISLNRVLGALKGAGRLRLVIVGASRDNTIAASMTRSTGSAASDQDQVNLPPNQDTVLAFASTAGHPALNAADGHSQFAIALAKFIGKPGVDLRRVLGMVRDEVMQSTNHRQSPYVYGVIKAENLELIR